MQAPTIRRLGSNDEADLRRLNDLFGKTFNDPVSYELEPPSAGYVAGLLSMDHVIALIALQNDNVVGGLVAYELPKFERERREIYIYDLAVDEKHRRKGTATALINHLRGIARERGGWVIYVQADYGDDPAVALYTKLGRREDVMHFDIPVND
ncbi:AAC(3)-I family aminoglycoside N-acetyltransferase [Rhizobium halophilum]|uniref:AAC(3)-I family aminoglycoside N-acetyltransferase n=1 Tax=Rhizobium halophilum TaxID=2846852 RepID=UPI001EFC94D0|nr:AAC(3)-I family aminoglycoside N-acetyltransferase [Rhizobium halophilum]MCF6368508.1 AAC(3)-I family aminoglycoside N-acetyltransferase [Rhizobium halophilum]